MRTFPAVLVLVLLVSVSSFADKKSAKDLYLFSKNEATRAALSDVLDSSNLETVLSNLISITLSVDTPVLESSHLLLCSVTCKFDSDLHLPLLQYRIMGVISLEANDTVYWFDTENMIISPGNARLFAQIFSSSHPRLVLVPQDSVSSAVEINPSDSTENDEVGSLLKYLNERARSTRCKAANALEEE
jgi:hypothetical protein